MNRYDIGGIGPVAYESKKGEWVKYKDLVSFAGYLVLAFEGLMKEVPTMNDHICAENSYKAVMKIWEDGK